MKPRIRRLVESWTLTLGLFMGAPTGWSQGDDGAADGKPATVSRGSPSAKGGSAPALDPQDEEIFPAAPEQPVRIKRFSSAEKAKICAKYQGRLIGYYGDVYRVEQCKRRPILNNKTVYQLMRDGQKVAEVDGDVMVALSEGQPLDLAMSSQNARGCRELEGHYISYSSTDVYFVEHCEKRIFPDWATYVEHRQKRGNERGEILSLSWLEFSQLKKGRPIPSIIDDMFAKLLRGDGSTDIIPIDEACKNLNGQVVAFYSRLYRVEKCRKREIVDTEAFMLATGLERSKIPDLTAQRWLSLPDGVPITEYQKHAQKEAAKPEPFRRSQAE